MASFFARFVKLRRTWAIASGVFTFVILPLGRMLWRRSKRTPPASKRQIIDVTAEIVESKTQDQKQDAL